MIQIQIKSIRPPKTHTPHAYLNDTAAPAPVRVAAEDGHAVGDLDGGPAMGDQDGGAVLGVVGRGGVCARKWDWNERHCFYRTCNYSSRAQHITSPLLNKPHKFSRSNHPHPSPYIYLPTCSTRSSAECSAASDTESRAAEISSKSCGEVIEWIYVLNEESRLNPIPKGEVHHTHHPTHTKQTAKTTTHEQPRVPQDRPGQCQTRALPPAELRAALADHLL